MKKITVRQGRQPRGRLSPYEFTGALDSCVWDTESILGGREEAKTDEDEVRVNSYEKKVGRYAHGGFTLIEVMIVIAIIGILSAVAVPNFIAYRDKAYCSGAESDANSIINTLAAYYAIPIHHGGFNGVISADGTLTPAQGINFRPLSHGNTATITTVGKGFRISVTETNGRCPKAYRLAQANAGWSTTATVFSKSL